MSGSTAQTPAVGSRTQTAGSDRVGTRAQHSTGGHHRGPAGHEVFRDPRGSPGGGPTRPLALFRCSSPPELRSRVLSGWVLRVGLTVCVDTNLHFWVGTKTVWARECEPNHTRKRHRCPAVAHGPRVTEIPSIVTQDTPGAQKSLAKKPGPVLEPSRARVLMYAVEYYSAMNKAKRQSPEETRRPPQTTRLSAVQVGGSARGPSEGF